MKKTNATNKTSTTWGILLEVDYLLKDVPSWETFDWRKERSRKNYLLTRMLPCRNNIRSKTRRKRFDIKIA